MNFAVKMTESLVRTVVVEADTYEQAEEKVSDAYYNGNIQLHADNSAVDLELENDTDNYIEIFGKEEFESMEVENCFKVPLLSLGDYFYEVQHNIAYPRLAHSERHIKYCMKNLGKTTFLTKEDIEKAGYKVW